jgi:pimeloyl-ACP methyl ester carboxylesterase
MAQLATWRPLARAYGRDVILIDRRGTGSSRPRTVCSHYLPTAALLSSYLDPSLRDDYQKTVATCSQEAAAAGAPAGTLGLAASAEDVERVRLALGVQQWYVMGDHFGARLALEVARRNPTSTAGLVLIAPEPAQGLGPAGIVDAADAATTALLSRCPSIPTCAPIGDGAAAWAAATAGLAQKPATQQAFATAYGKNVPVRIYARSAWPALVDVLEHTEDLATFFPALRDELPLGDWGALAHARVDAVRPIDWSMAATLDVRCEAPTAPAEDQAWTDFQRRVTKWDDLLMFSGEPVGCAARGATPDPSIATVVNSAVPSLVLRGELDPLVDADQVAQATSGLSRATSVTFALGAADAPSGQCGRDLVGAFLTSPGAPIDTSCAAATPAWAAAGP